MFIQVGITKTIALYQGPRAKNWVVGGKRSVYIHLRKVFPCFSVLDNHGSKFVFVDFKNVKGSFT